MDGSVGWWAVGVTAAIVLAVVGLTTALGVADSRRDEATLASVGAPAGLRRSTTAAQVLAIAAIGLVLGAAVGLVTLAGLMHSSPRGYLPMAVPWWELGAFVVGVPLLGAALTWLVTPPRGFGRTAGTPDRRGLRGASLWSKVGCSSIFDRGGSEAVRSVRPQAICDPALHLVGRTFVKGSRRICG